MKAGGEYVVNIMGTECVVDKAGGEDYVKKKKKIRCRIRREQKIVSYARNTFNIQTDMEDLSI